MIPTVLPRDSVNHNMDGKICLNGVLDLIADMQGMKVPLRQHQVSCVARQYFNASHGCLQRQNIKEALGRKTNSSSLAAQTASPVLQ